VASKICARDFDYTRLTELFLADVSDVVAQISWLLSGDSLLGSLVAEVFFGDGFIKI
jgi:hypothetical protein